MTEICPSCGHPLTPGAPVCDHCGVPALEPPAWEDAAPLNTSHTFRGQLPAYGGPDEAYSFSGPDLDPTGLPHVSSLPPPLELMQAPPTQPQQGLPQAHALPLPSAPLQGELPVPPPAVPADDPHRPSKPDGDADQQEAGEGREASASPKAPDPLAAIHQFGPPPERPWGSLAYFVRVYIRRRVLTDELVERVQARKRAEARVDELHYRIGETLFMHRNDPRLVALARNFQVVAQADHQVDDRMSTGDEVRRNALAGLEKQQTQIERAKMATEPIRMQEAQLVATEAKLKGQVNQVRAALRKLDQDIKRSTAAGPGSPEAVQLMAAQAQRQAQEQGLSERLQAVTSELGRTRNRLARAEATVAAEQAKHEEMNVALARKSVRLTVATGTAREALQRALRSVSEVAIASDLTFLAQGQVDKLQAAQEKVEATRKQEAEHRAAISAFDHEAYDIGQKMLVGGTVVLFLTLVFLVFF